MDLSRASSASSYATPAASGSEGTPLGPQERLEGLDHTAEKTAKVAEDYFVKLKDESLHILSVLEQYNFSIETKTAFRNLSKYLSAPSDLIEINKFNQLSDAARKGLSDEIQRLGEKSLDDFKPVRSDFKRAKFLDSVDGWEKSIGSLKGALIESELSALPNIAVQVQVINPHVAKHILDARRSLAEGKDISQSTLRALSEPLTLAGNEPDKSDQCIRMGSTCAISLNDPQVNSNVYIIELETAFASKFQPISGSPEGHSPDKRPQSLRFALVDNVATILSRISQIPKMKENETIFSFSFPTLIIRPKREDQSLMALDSIKNRYPSQLNAISHGTPDNLGDQCEGCKNGTHSDDSKRLYECSNIQLQYADIKRQCDDIDATIVGKCDIIQRVVYRKGCLVFEKGIRGGEMTELMKVSVDSLLL